LKKNNKGQSSKRYNSKKLNDFNPNKYTCFGCGEQGHIRQSVLTMRTKRKHNSKEKGEENPRKPT